MKTTHKLVLAWTAGCLGISVLTTGCLYEGPPQANVAVGVEFVPDYCFWDGDDYVGWYGDRYYYWGPNRAWIACDPVRVQHVNVWVNAHPDWRSHATAMAPERVNAAPAGHSSPAPRARRYYQEEGAQHDRKADHDHN